MLNTPADWLPLQDMLRTILVDSSEGLTEFELLKLLQNPPFEVFKQVDLQQPLVLFQTHFILFNALYHLRDSLLAEQIGILQVSCMSIRINPWLPGQAGLQQQDKLRDYYLDWQQLATTDQQEVENLLDSFWQGMSGKSTNTPATSVNKHMPIDDALAVLELAELVSTAELKKQYRKMLHKHHPDKGGSNIKTRLLLQAYESVIEELKI